MKYYRFVLSLLAAPIMVFCLVAPQAIAEPLQRITLNFTATGFDATAPTDPVTGTIIYEAASVHGPIQSFESIDMTIAGHSYSVGEIGFTFNSYWDLIGGVTAGVTQIYTQTDDFWLRWYPSSLTPFDFFYTASAQAGIWDCAVYNPVNFTSFSITVTPIPEPTSAILLLAGTALCCLKGLRTSGCTERRVNAPVSFCASLVRRR